MKRNRILNPRVVGVKGDDVVNSHRDHLLEGESAVKRLSCGPFMLPALIEIRHNDGNAPCLSAYGSNDPL